MAVNVIVAHWGNFNPDILESPSLLPRSISSFITPPSSFKPVRSSPAIIMGSVQGSYLKFSDRLLGKPSLLGSVSHLSVDLVIRDWHNLLLSYPSPSVQRPHLTEKTTQGSGSGIQ